MTYMIEHITNALKNAREIKGLSQRALSRITGVPQSHISKIENGAVDLRLSSLIELARVLDLELTLVPRKAVPAVKSIVRSSEGSTDLRNGNLRTSLKELKRFQDTLAGFSKVNQATNELTSLNRRLKDLTHFRLARSELETIRTLNKMLKGVNSNTKNLDVFRQVDSQLQILRNSLAHDSVNLPRIESVRPAYILDDEDEDA